MKDIGFRVHVSRHLADVRFSSDSFFAWWPTTAIVPLTIARIRSRPLLLVAAASSIVHDFQGLEYEIGYYSCSRVKQKLVSLSIRSADCVLAVSQHVAKQAHLLGARHVSLVPCAIDTVTYSPDPQQLAADYPYVLCIASDLSEDYLRRKRVESLLRAFRIVNASFPEVVLKVVGRRGNALSRLRELTESLSIARSVDFVGAVSEDQKIQLLRGALVYAQPTRHENFGVAIAEAMSCTTPVVTSPVAAVPEVLGDCGLYAPPDDPGAIADRLLLILRDPSGAKELGKRARRRVEENFSISNRSQGLRAVFSELGIL